MQMILMKLELKTDCTPKPTCYKQHPFQLLFQFHSWPAAPIHVQIWSSYDIFLLVHCRTRSVKTLRLISLFIMEVIKRWQFAQEALQGVDFDCMFRHVTQISQKWSFCFRNTNRGFITVITWKQLFPFALVTAFSKMRKQKLTELHFVDYEIVSLLW